jgi:hypothetical protein
LGAFFVIGLNWFKRYGIDKTKAPFGAFAVKLLLN